MTIGKKVAWGSAVAALAIAGVTGRAQQQGPPIVNPQIPQPIFRAPEDVWKTGVKPEDIKAGVLPDFKKVRDQLVVIPVQGNIWLIGGAGSNIAMQVNDQGVLLVDAGVDEAAERVMTEIRKQLPKPLRWIINTNADMDHTGGNDKIAKVGANAIAAAANGGGGGQGAGFNGNGAAILAFENVLNRMSAPTGQAAARNVDAWPTDTFFTARKNIWFDDEPIELWHQPAAHTDGDIMVFFRKSDVIAAGDILADDRYPVIDADKGGSIQGILDGLNHIVGVAVPEYNQQGGTRIIPGHGRICNQTDVVEYRDMATIVRDRISMLAKKGMSLDQVKAAHPTLDYDGQYGATSGAWTTDMFINEVYKEVTKPMAPAAGAKKPAAPAKKG